MQIAPEDFLQTFRKGFHSLGTEPGQCTKDARGAFYASCKSSPRHTPGMCRPPQLSSALLSIAADLLRLMHMAFRSAALLFPQQSLLLLAPGSFTTHACCVIFHTAASSAMAQQPTSCRATPRPWMFPLSLRPLWRCHQLDTEQGNVRIARHPGVIQQFLRAWWGTLQVKEIKSLV